MKGVIGIDPGKKGGIALICPGVIETAVMPETERDVFRLLKRLMIDADYVLIEEAQARPGQARTHIFFQGYGFLRGVLTALEIPFESINATVWQRGMAVPPTTRTKRKKDSRPTTKTEKEKHAKARRQEASKRKREHKIKLKQKAQSLFPSIDVRMETADALLIAEYARRRQMGESGQGLERVRL